MKLKTETEITEGFKLGNPKVLQDIYRNLFPQVKAFIAKHGGSEQEAKDVFQDALVFTFEKLRSDALLLKCSLTTYIFAVSKNMWRNVLRKKRKTQTLDCESNIPKSVVESIIDEIEEQDKKLLFQKHFVKLSNACKELLKFVFLGKSMAEIGAAMGYSTGYTRKKKFECKQKLLMMIEVDPIYVELQSESLSTKTK